MGSTPLEEWWREEEWACGQVELWFQQNKAKVCSGRSVELDGPLAFPPRGYRPGRTRHSRWCPQGGRWSLSRCILKAEGNSWGRLKEERAVCIQQSWQLGASVLKEGLGGTPQHLLRLFLPSLHSTWQLQVDICVFIWLILLSPLTLEQRAETCQYQWHSIGHREKECDGCIHGGG